MGNLTTASGVPVRPRQRLSRTAVASVATAAALSWLATPVQATSAGGAQVVTSAHAAHVTARDGSAAATQCDPYASLQPPPGPPTVTPGSFMATVRARGYLIAGVDQNSYRLEYLNPRDGQIEGFDIDMLHAIAAAIFGDPSKIKYVATTNAQREPFVESGRVDIVAHTMTITCARLQDVDFSTVYFDAGQQILVEDGSPIHGVQDIAQRRVCAAPGSTSLARLSQYHAIQVPAQSYTDCLVLLQQGQVDAISTDNSILEGLAAQDPYARIVGTTFSDEPYGLAISKQHPDFVRFVNAVLAQMRADGQWAASYESWLGSPVPPPPSVRYQG